MGKLATFQNFKWSFFQLPSTIHCFYGPYMPCPSSLSCCFNVFYRFLKNIPSWKVLKKLQFAHLHFQMAKKLALIPFWLFVSFQHHEIWITLKFKNVKIQNWKMYNPCSRFFFPHNELLSIKLNTNPSKDYYNRSPNYQFSHCIENIWGNSSSFPIFS